VRIARYASFLVLALIALVFVGVRARYGGGEAFPDRSGVPAYGADALELVAELPFPPGNITVSPGGRIFATYHPEGAPPYPLFEIVDGKPVAYPPSGLPGDLAFQTPLALRADTKNRLWVLDHGRYGFGTARLLAFDLDSGALVHRHDFPGKIALLGSMLNDFAVSPDGRTIFIADASLFTLVPGLVVYSVSTQKSQRLLDSHESVSAEDYAPVVQGRRMEFYGAFTVRPGVDSIALDENGFWLYFGAVTSHHLYRIATADLLNANLSWRELESRVERFAEKTMSDGIAIDGEGTVYLSDFEHSAIVALDQDRQLRTLVKDDRLRWPDGLAFGPDGWLYVTCSALHQLILQGAGEVAANAPYQIWRLRPS
jgi:sugar lactone lactonase YvrE